MFELKYLLILTSLTLGSRGQEVKTEQGLVKGSQIEVSGSRVDVFHGIPYAKPPIGDLRFGQPSPPDSWGSKVKDATVEPPSCMQSTKFSRAIPAEEIYYVPEGFNEDCLYLSIWRPSTEGSQRAVMVWLYGGGFSMGSTRVQANDGKYLAAENDVIVISVNYRVGALGFSYLSSDSVPGNMGLLDQVEALRWIQKNVGHFGGDKNKVTLFGQSAGAIAIGLHLVSPLSRDLFNNAIPQSGAPTTSVVKSLIATSSEGRANGLQLAEALKCTGTDLELLDCMRKVDAKNIIDASDDLLMKGVAFSPVVDGAFLPEDPNTLYQKGEYTKADLLAGVTKDEATLFFYFMMDTKKQTFFSGQEVNSETIGTGLTSLARMADTHRVSATVKFYESEATLPVDYIQVMNRMVSDITLKCNVLRLCSIYSESNAVFLYSMDHRASNMVHEEWMGVPHGYEMAFAFGIPLDDTLGYTDEEKTLSRTVMTYWTNFAKSGNPNKPVTPSTSWEPFSKTSQDYMSLGINGNLATRQGFRRIQCTFINEILPEIPTDDEWNKYTDNQQTCERP